MSSLAATEGGRSQVAYGASKGGVHGLTMPMARDLGKFQIRVMAL